MNLFHKIVYKTFPVNIPDYLTLYSGCQPECPMAEYPTGLEGLVNWLGIQFQVT